MASLDIFNDDAFSVTQLTQTIIDIPLVPTQLGDEGLFTQSGISTTSMFIERKGSELSLVASAPRGGIRQPLKSTGSKLIPIMAIHLPQGDTVMADAVQNARAFGSETEVQTVQGLVKDKLAKMKGQLDLTLEYQRIGAMRGLVLDADGTTLYDLYQMFGMTQQSLHFDFTNSTSDLQAKTISIKRAIRAKLGGKSSKGVRVKCSESWFDSFTRHTEMKKLWALWQAGQYGREDPSEADFAFNGVVFQIYSGGTSAGDFIPAGEAYAYPVGVPGMFQQVFAPGDYMGIVNTKGVPYYASQERLPHDKGVDLESQSNPITYNSLPEAVIRLDGAAS